MKNAKRLIALLLAAVMMFAVVGCGNEPDVPETTAPQESQGGEVVQTEPVNELAWLNTSGSMPIVAEGTEKTLSMYVWRQMNTGDLEDTWMYQYVTEVMNINIEATKFDDSNKKEFISMALASGEIPDMITGYAFTTAELVKYGQNEGLFLDLAPYINETYMPNLTALLEEHPELRAAWFDTEGHCYSLGFYNASTTGGTGYFMNYSWMEEAGITEAPTTLDEFLETARAMKAVHPDRYPIGGSWVRHTSMDYILNAFGYFGVGGYSNGMKVALKDGEPVIPVADREAYGEFLKFMKTCYDEGLMHPDYFTMDKATTESLTSANTWGLYAQSPQFYVDTWREWWGAAPLASEYEENPRVPRSNGANTGGVVVSAKCENPELAVAFIDWFFTNRNRTMSQYGPNAELDAEYLFGFDGWVVDEATGTIKQLYIDKVGAENYNETEYLNSIMFIQHQNGLGVDSHDETSIQPDANAPLYELDLSDPAIRFDETALPTDTQWRDAAQYAIGSQYPFDYVYPSTTYMSAEDAEELNILWVAVKEYATQETAKFITGARELSDSELEKYFNEIESVGASELLELYKAYYVPVQ